MNRLDEFEMYFLDQTERAMFATALLSVYIFFFSSHFGYSIL